MKAARNEEGASLVEYALLLVLLVVVAMSIMAVIGNTNADSFSSVVEQGYGN
jgi:Flp pilus assembly pilin Flp